MIKIEKNHPDFKAFKFVLRAKSNDQIKPLFACVFSDGTNAVCTDTSRLHIVKLEQELPAGLYDVITSTSKEIILNESTVEGQFPNYKQVLYKEKDKPVKLSEWNKWVSGAQTLFDIMSKGICVNPEYVKHACEDCGKLEIITTNSNSPVQITNDFGIAAIMPLQINRASE